MRSYLRIHSPWSQLAVFILLLSGAFIFTTFLSFVVFVAKGIGFTEMRNIDYGDPKIIGILKLIQGISTITIFLLPALIFSLITFRFRHFYFLGFRKQQDPVFYMLAFALVICAFPFVAWLGQLNQHIPLTKWMIDSEKEASRQMQAFLKVNDSSDVAINLLLVALLPAICEEVFFRGGLQRILIYLFKNPVAGIIVTAALFSAFHLQFEGFLPRMFLGILLGTLFWYGKSLWPGIVAHFIYNAIQVVAVIYYPNMIDQNPAVPLYAALISGMLVFGILYFLRRKSSATYASEYEMEKVNEFNEFLS